MHKERTELNILFQRVFPEKVLDWIRQGNTIYDENFIKKQYLYSSTIDMQEYSSDEIEIRYESMENVIKQAKGKGIYDVLFLYADKVLDLNGDMPVCRLETILNWSAISANLGQDIFTTAWLAHYDLQRYGDKRVLHDFSWPAVLKTNDKRLEYLFKKGLAENHYHLYGSTQSFSISWACLMNNPNDSTDLFLKNFNENLSPTMLKNSNDVIFDWPTRIKYAAYIRVLLFKRCLELVDSDTLYKDFLQFDVFPLVRTINSEIDALRFCYGYKFQQPKNESKCLDYAITETFYRVNEESYNRLLGGERNFLYQCFKKIYSNQFTPLEESLFHLYLLLKSNFRSEMVQNNGRVGFSNFSDYQRRKNQFFGKYKEYATESQRLSVCVAIAENHVQSLEVRIMPELKWRKMHKRIASIDKESSFAIEGIENDFFYVIHFPKSKFMKKEFIEKDYLVPRNVNVRKIAKKAAIELGKYFQEHPYDEQRIYGIDACSKEIGCRPEVFATEFRYLRECSKLQRDIPWYKFEQKQNKELRITYHVGEDFLDIMDGLRAIDEAIFFLEMKRGDRLGHAVALGIDAEKYYNFKGNSLFLSKQDYLDNLVWILYRSTELGVEIESKYRIVLEQKARELLWQIYPILNTYSNALDLYYFSWKLRGDHPDLYKNNKYDSSSILNVIHTYYDAMERKNENLELYRQNDIIASCIYHYHFDKQTKEVGLLPEEIVVKNWYISLVTQMQLAMQEMIALQGIAIECNPTSNLRISSIQDYADHPILVFNNEYLEDDPLNSHLMVSINTDDIGVFDTSLENEYALMYAAICKKRHEEGILDDHAVEKYLDYLRINGIVMAFK